MANEFIYSEVEGVGGETLIAELRNSRTNELIQVRFPTMPAGKTTLIESVEIPKDTDELREGDKLYFLVSYNYIPLSSTESKEFYVTYKPEGKLTSIQIYEDRGCTRVANIVYYGKTVYVRVLTRNLWGATIKLNVIKKEPGTNAGMMIWDFVSQWLFKEIQSKSLLPVEKEVDNDGVAVFEVAVNKQWYEADKNTYFFHAAGIGKNANMEIGKTTTAESKEDDKKKYPAASRNFRAMDEPQTNGTTLSITMVKEIGAIGKIKCPRCYHPDPLGISNLQQIFSATDEDLNGNSSKNKSTHRNIIDPARNDPTKQKQDNMRHRLRQLVKELINPYSCKTEDGKTASLPLYEIFKLNTCLRRAHFFAQALQEVGTTLEDALYGENLNYNYDGLLGFSYFKNHTDEAKKYCRIGDYPNIEREANQEMIANLIYGKDSKQGIENGNTQPGDGWRFRGRGLLQTTGREGFEANQNIVNKLLLGKSGVNLLVDGNAAYTMQQAVVMGLAEWYRNRLEYVADGGVDASDVDNITQIINGGTSSYYQRENHFAKTQKIFRVSECINEYGPTMIKEGYIHTYDNAYQAKDASTSYIDVIQPSDRRSEGLLVLFDNTGILFMCYALARGLSRDRLSPEPVCGDTPTGLTSTFWKDEKNHPSYGKYGAIDLMNSGGLTGQFAEAQKIDVIIF